MGHNEKRYLVDILTKVLETNIELMKYLKSVASDTKSKRVCTKSILNSRKAIETLPKIEHVEILKSLYNLLISGKENTFAVGGSVIISKQTKYWDQTEEGFKEFIELENENKKKYQEQMEKRQKYQETLKQAKEQGKKVDMVYNNGELEPIIVENNDKE